MSKHRITDDGSDRSGCLVVVLILVGIIAVVTAALALRHGG